MPNYHRTVNDLQRSAIRQWPQEIRQRLGDINILQKLIDTQDTFISILRVSNATPLAWEAVLTQNSTISKRLFLKHLLLLSDIGGESLNKISPLSRYIPSNTLRFQWNDSYFEYIFQVIGEDCSLTNTSLKVDAKSLLDMEADLTPKMRDVAMLILYGSLSEGNSLPPEIEEKCIIGTLIGKDDELDAFVRQNYIRVSRQIGGTISNGLGQTLQQYIVGQLSRLLPDNWSVRSNSILPNVLHDNKPTTFDVIVKSPYSKYCGIEISFQVTTNSVIERKARESEALYNSVHGAGHKIAYIIDGAGNIDVRKQAVSVICNQSDCTVTMSPKELNFLVKFLMETLV